MVLGSVQERAARIMSSGFIRLNLRARTEIPKPKWKRRNRRGQCPSGLNLQPHTRKGVSIAKKLRALLKEAQILSVKRPCFSIVEITYKT